MAGIVAVFTKKRIRQQDLATLKAMLRAISHRGPHESQIIASERALIGISILENEPMENHIWKGGPSAKAVVCDGNVLDAEQNMLDAEQISIVFENEDLPSISSLSGAFAIIGFNEGDFYISRDFLGVKPLYQGFRDGDLYLSSELKGLPAFVDGIDVFPPGQFYSTRLGLVKYFDFPTVEMAPESAELIAKRVRKNLEQAVDIGVSSHGDEDNLAALLSGGVDSSIITAILSRTVANLDTVTVGTEDSEDLEYARKAADYLNTNHHESVYSSDKILASLDDVIYHLESYEAPTVRSSVANYFAAKEAAKCATGVFIGEGGDEDFGGYHHLKDEPQFVNKNLVTLLESLHNIGCQRVDRMNMRFSLEVYAPFLNKDLMVLPSLRIPAGLKIHGGSQTEKWILRKSFEDYLPDELIWRAKKQFARGAGFERVLNRHVNDLISDEQFEDEVRELPENTVRTKEELFYYHIFTEHFPHPDAPKTVGLWSE